MSAYEFEYPDFEGFQIIQIDRTDPRPSSGVASVLFAGPEDGWSSCVLLATVFDDYENISVVAINGHNYPVRSTHSIDRNVGLRCVISCISDYFKEWIIKCVKVFDSASQLEVFRVIYSDPDLDVIVNDIMEHSVYETFDIYTNFVNVLLSRECFNSLHTSVIRDVDFI